MGKANLGPDWNNYIHVQKNYGLLYIGNNFRYFRYGSSGFFFKFFAYITWSEGFEYDSE